MLTVKACLPAPGGVRPRPRDPDELDHRADHRLPRLVALRRHEGGPARLPAHGLHRARAEADHGERGAARATSSPRGWTSSGPSTARRWRRRSRSAGSAPSRRSARRRCSWRPTRPATSPARRSSSTAARSLPESLAALQADVAVTEPVPGLPAAFAPLGPSASALRDRLRPRSPPARPGRASGWAPSASWPRAWASAARRCARRSTRSRRPAPCAACAAARAGSSSRERKVERDLTSLDRPARLPAPAGLPVGRAGALDRDGRAPTPRRPRRSTCRRARSCSRSCACAWPTSSRSRSSGPASRPTASPACSTARWPGSLYELLETDYGLRPARPRSGSRWSARRAAEARVLERAPRARRWSRSRARRGRRDGRPFERSHDLFRADRVRIVVRVRTPRPGRRSAAPCEVVGAERRTCTLRYVGGQPMAEHVITREAPTHRSWDVDIEPVLRDRSPATSSPPRPTTSPAARSRATRPPPTCRRSTST